jgi:hypothetical protein
MIVRLIRSLSQVPAHALAEVLKGAVTRTARYGVNRLTEQPALPFILQGLSVPKLTPCATDKEGGSYPLSHYRSDRRLLMLVATLSLFMTTPT